MIIYFSSTGNCQYVAENLAAELEDMAMSILCADRIHLSSGEKLGFIFPTYFWRLPSIVDDYMNILTITSDDAEPYIYFIATYGTTCGQTGTFMKKHLKKKGYRLSAMYSIKMIDDWTVFFDLSDSKIVSKALNAEKPLIGEVISSVKNEQKGNMMKSTLPMIVVYGSGYFYDIARKTKHLHADNRCIGCGLCSKECPSKAIEIKDSKPVWTKRKCAMCLHCLHSCPAFAIHYNNKTQDHGQYKHPGFCKKN